MDRIDRLRIFCQVVEKRSFTAAAVVLGLPRSSVSAAVQALETTVGARLIDRTTRRVAATAEGLALRERALAILTDLDEAEGLFRVAPAALSGHVRLSAPNRVVTRLIVPALPSFFARHPGLSVDVDATERAVDLLAEGVDCAVRFGDRTAPGTLRRPIGACVIASVASPAYIARQGTPPTPDDLGSHQVIAYASPTTGRTEPWEWVQNGELRSQVLANALTVNSGEALIAACISGLGLIQVPAFDVADDLAAGRLVEVMPAFRAAPLQVALLVPEHRSASRRVAALVDWLTPLLSTAIVSVDTILETGRGSL